MLRITVCRDCGWSEKKIRHALERVAKKHGDEVAVERVPCLDLCKRGPALRVGTKTLAPARPGKVKRLVKKQLAKQA